MTDTFAPVQDESLKRAAAEEAMRLASQPFEEPSQEQIETVSPPETIVELPGGLVTIDGIVKTAEVRELTGADEEAFAKQNNVGKVLLTIINRGVVSVGDAKATPEMLDSMLIGDREALLLAIRKATYGPEVLVNVTCYECGHAEENAVINLDTDVPTRIMSEDDDREFTVQLKKGTARVALPNGAVQKKIISAGEKTIAELNTVLIGSCLIEINDLPVVNGEVTARNLGLHDREKITEEIAKRAPGPRLREVVKVCAECGAEIPVPLDLASLFRL